MKFEEVCRSFNVFLAQNHFISVLLPIAVPVMLVCVALQWLGMFVSLGGIVNAISYLGFFFMLLLVLSLCNFKMAAVGLGIYSLQYLFTFMKSLISYRSVNWAGIIYLAVYLYLAYRSYKKSLSI